MNPHLTAPATRDIATVDTTARAASVRSDSPKGPPMKKIALILTALGVLLVGAGMSNTAAAFNYPPDETTDITTNEPTVGPGDPFNATVTNCLPGEPVIFTFEGVTRTVNCDPSTLQATQPFVAPMAPGTYEVCADLTGTGVTVPSGVTRPLTVCTTIQVLAAGPTVPPTTPGGGLPGTGSSGLGTTTTSAIVLLGAGALLLVVSQVRRRRTAPA